MTQTFLRPTSLKISLGRKVLIDTSEEARTFLEPILLEINPSYQWMARDFHGTVCLFKAKPEKYFNEGEFEGWICTDNISPWEMEPGLIEDLFVAEGLAEWLLIDPEDSLVQIQKVGKENGEQGRSL